ncbi:hypothetical protein QBC38DRAFT_147979 [Podospora fimiseda]|uniref:Uncharacterized protein n=1 Tax=Podospora fimiseda TaxID=252190 RepID=A0AAN7BSD0_9PEZI|nr:hypothetical protein QBC38DRAFT_147979 [Podospora fimiseda]
MSDIIESLKDVVNPSRHEEATHETYNPHTRGPYPDREPTSQKPENQPSLALPVENEAENPARAEQTNLSLDKTAETPKTSK